MRKFILGYLLIFLMTVNIVAAVRAKEVCLNTTHQLITFDFELTEDGTATGYNYTQVHRCERNCTNGQCESTYSEGDVSMMWMVYGTGVTLLILGTFMGNLFQRLFRGHEQLVEGFSTQSIVKFIFFFAGLYLINMGMGMASGISSEYGGSTLVSGGMISVINVMSWSLFIFLFVFIVEFLYSLLKSWRVTQEKKKWG